MAEEVAATWQEFQDYQDLRVLEIGMDLAYFKHLRYIGDSLDPVSYTHLDVYKRQTDKRAGLVEAIVEKVVASYGR